MEPSAFGPAPANVDSRDWKELTSAFSSISSPDFAVKPADFIDPKDLGNGQQNRHTHSLSATAQPQPAHHQHTQAATPRRAAQPHADTDNSLLYLISARTAHSPTILTPLSLPPFPPPCRPEVGA